MGRCGCSGARVVLWGLWIVNALASIIYLGVSMYTFNNVRTGVSHLSSFPNSDAFKSSMLSATMLGFIVVLFFLVFSFFVLAIGMFRDVSLGYGIMLGACTHTSFFMLLAGLVLQSDESLADAFHKKGIWSLNAYRSYVVTYGFSYLLVGLYALLFFALFFLRSSAGGKAKESKYYIKESLSGTAPSSSAAAATAAPPPAVVELPPSSSLSKLQKYDSKGFGSNTNPGWGSNYGTQV